VQINRTDTKIGSVITTERQETVVQLLVRAAIEMIESLVGDSRYCSNMYSYGYEYMQYTIYDDQLFLNRLIVIEFGHQSCSPSVDKTCDHLEEACGFSSKASKSQEEKY
jgi:hypothetical protein